jgi:glucokinase
VTVDNDANCATWAEAQLGPGKGLDNVLGIMVGTGIGMGLVAGGNIYRGRAFAGEAGHVTMVPSGGLACPCGRAGCWETLISGWRLAQLWGEGRTGDASSVSRAAAAGDRRALLIIDDAGRALGVGIANLIALLDPDIVVVGGGVIAGTGEQLLERARDEIGSRLEGVEHRPPTPVVAGEFGVFAGAVGAALFAANPFGGVGL